ncbi:hypothetical protein [Aquimarina spongiae]|uniref:DUF4136 domain-containing protein n=1 Tax=Aquimarina spongiae TaxID=570521 RepID=A0A1M6CVF3_9FLAO|nr:hypothetical protein [Aquimarina spongiae]SHI64939.1 hypothetical protein SAMN04488508_102298 [Aquimarina spongiae]
MKTTRKLLVVLFILGTMIGCNDSIDSTEFNFTELARSLEVSDLENFTVKAITDSIPVTRDDLNSMRTVVKVFNGKDDAGVTIPGFGGLKLGKKETSLNVYYVETKIVRRQNDTVVYGIGYSTHYLFKKLKRGIDISNLASVAASAQLQSNRTSVYYSLQTFGIKSRELVNYFKPQVNSNFDVDGFGVIQSSIDGIHNVLADSLLSKRTQFTPMELKFVKPTDLQQ